MTDREAERHAKAAVIRKAPQKFAHCNGCFSLVSRRYLDKATFRICPNCKHYRFDEGPRAKQIVLDAVDAALCSDNVPVWD